MEKHPEKIRWGIVGLGKIAAKFAADLALHENAVLVAVASNSKERGEAFANQFRVSKVFDNYEALFSSPEVDVVYVANVHTQHVMTSISAMKHGKHVLCEKPAGMNAEEVQNMIRVSRENRVFFMEALWSRFNPSIRKIKDLIDQGAIGPLRYVHADFCFHALDRDENGRLLNPELGGGSLLDIGIYPVFLAYLLLGAPDDIDARSKFFHTGAEIQTSMLFEYPRSLAILHSSLANTSPVQAHISGEKGTIHINPRWHETSGFKLVKEGHEEEVIIPVTGNGYYHEIEEVQQCIRRGVLESELWSHEDSLQLIRLLDQIRDRSGITFP